MAFDADPLLEKESLISQGQGNRRFPEYFFDVGSAFYEGALVFMRTGLSQMFKNSFWMAMLGYVKGSLLCQRQESLDSVLCEGVSG